MSKQTYEVTLTVRSSANADDVLATITAAVQVDDPTAEVEIDDWSEIQ